MHIGVLCSRLFSFPVPTHVVLVGRGGYFSGDYGMYCHFTYPSMTTIRWCLELLYRVRDLSCCPCSYTMVLCMITCTCTGVGTCTCTLLALLSHSQNSLVLSLILLIMSRIICRAHLQTFWGVLQLLKPGSRTIRS